VYRAIAYSLVGRLELNNNAGKKKKKKKKKPAPEKNCVVQRAIRRNQ
jgi:hypothetical protein